MHTIWGCDLQARGITVAACSGIGQPMALDRALHSPHTPIDRLSDLQKLSDWRAGDGVVLVLPSEWVQQCELPIADRASVAQTRQQLWQMLQFQAGWSPETHVIDWWVDRSAHPATAMVYCIEQERIEACRQDILNMKGIPLMATPASLARMWAGVSAPSDESSEPDTWRCAWGGIQAWWSQERSK